MKHIFMLFFLNRFFFLLLLIGALPLIALRLFGLLFFLTTTPLWAGAPSVTLLVLLFVASGAKRPSMILFIIAIGIFVASVVFHGWDDLKWRIANEGSAEFDVLELLVILLLSIRTLIIRQLDWSTQFGPD